MMNKKLNINLVMAAMIFLITNADLNAQSRTQDMRATENYSPTAPSKKFFDFDGDGKSDIAVFRPSAATFYWLNSSTGGFQASVFGFGTDIPTPGDFDGDGKTDIAVFRPSANAWYYLRSSNGSFYGESFGASTDQAIPVAFQ